VTNPLKIPGVAGDPRLYQEYEGFISMEQGTLQADSYPTEQQAVQEWNRMVRRIIRECRKGAK